MSLKKDNTFIFFCMAILMVSCTSRKNLVYFQGSFENSEAKIYTPVLAINDLLSITVMGMDAESVKPFNLPVVPVYSNTTGGYSQGTPAPIGYLVDADGNIDFPVLGRIKVGGLNRMQAVDMLKEKLTAYISNPIVNIRILNFKVTVLGEVRTPGTFNIPNERITLPEALGIAGDLNITAIRKKILVIRETEGKRTEYQVDLTSKSLFSSPVYYLNQNDVVYVQPNRTKVNASAINPSNAGIIISAISLVVTVLALLTR